MKHCILAKFLPEKTAEEKKILTDDAEALFLKLNAMQGIHGVRVLRNCVDRANRYDLMIEIDMDRDALERYDVSPEHLEWKERFGSLLEKKAIFDHE